MKEIVKDNAKNLDLSNWKYEVPIYQDGKDCRKNRLGGNN